MPIEFTTRTQDLAHAVRQLEVNRGDFADTDFADLEVTPSTLDLKAVGTETSIAADGTKVGTAHIPLRVLVKIVGVAKSYQRKESTILVEDGFVKIGRTKVSHPDITAGFQRTASLSIPPDASALDVRSRFYNDP